MSRKKGRLPTARHSRFTQSRNRRRAQDCLGGLRPHDRNQRREPHPRRIRDVAQRVEFAGLVLERGNVVPGVRRQGLAQHRVKGDCGCAGSPSP